MNFCTLFDSYYIHKGIATYLSLERVTEDFHLYVMAFDKDSYNKLKEIGFKHMTVELVDDFETPELLAVKPTRNKAEYCWTCGPSVIWHFMQKYKLPDITYIDADLFFMSSPQIIFDEIGDKSIGLTEHNNVDSSISGRFCVQYNYFKNDEEGVKALKWWRDSCIDWCFSRFEDGKFGDQRYLDAFPQRYNNICVVENRGVGIGSWNMLRYKFTDTDLTFEGKKYPFVFFHMHGIKMDIVDKELIIKSINVYLKDQTERIFFHPYAELMMEVYNKYLGKEVNRYKIIKKPWYKELYVHIRRPFRHNRFFQWFYYKVLNHRYSGNESKQV